MAALLRIGVQIFAIDSSAAVALARVRDTCRRRMLDAVALHTTLTTGSVLATFDTGLITAAGRAGVAIAS